MMSFKREFVHMRYKIQSLAVLCAAWLLAGACGSATAQVTWDPNAGVGDWNDPNNWIGGFVPDSFFNSGAVINNGGHAQVLDNSVPDSPSVDIATSDGPGTVSVNPDEVGTASLTVAAGGSMGKLTVGGLLSTGTLNIFNGATVTAVEVASGGNPNSAINISGTGSLTTGPAGLGATTRITGPSATFSTSSVSFGSASTLVADITATSHSTITASTAAVLGGTLQVEFSGGFTPASGQSWDLVQSPQLSGNFSSIDTSSVTGLASNEGFYVEKVAVGPDTAARLRLEELLVLTVNRVTNEISITNPSTSNTRDFDSYAITSASGSLAPANWNTLETQLGDNWVASTGSATANQLGELKTIGVTTAATSSTQSLGNIYSPPVPTQLGEEVGEDVQFEYSLPGVGSVVAPVEYVGGTKQFNNMVLTVDPNTGQAQMTNQSQFFSANLETYVITSAAGSLLPGTWDSLDDQNVAGGNWVESNPSATQLAELKPTGSFTFGTGSSPSFLMGTLFNDAMPHDLVFEYSLEGETEFRQGVVVYGAISIPGDFDSDGDGDVDD